MVEVKTVVSGGRVTGEGVQETLLVAGNVLFLDLAGGVTDVHTGKNAPQYTLDIITLYCI